MTRSRFSQSAGILFAGDLDNKSDLLRCLDNIVDYIAAVKIGNALLYTTGPQLVKEVKRAYGLPVIADLKLTDVSHVATRVAACFADNEADAIIVSGVCGKTVFDDIVATIPAKCELWVFTEFTHMDGLIDQTLADESICLAVQAGAKGVQVPATRPYRIESVRAAVGKDVAIVSCGIGVQGGKIGSAISAGANYEIIGRTIYGCTDPKDAARKIKESIERTGVSK